MRNIGWNNRTGNVHDVKLKGIRANIYAVEKPYLLYSMIVIIYSLRYPACSTHAPYYFVIRGLSGYTIFFDVISQLSRVTGGGGGVFAL